MAAPTITWFPYTLASPGTEGSVITVLDFGNVQAGFWSDAKCIIARFTGNTANTLKFWLNDTAATGGNTDVSTNWDHYYAIDTTYIDPSGVIDNMKVGGEVDANGNTWAVLPESEPGGSNFEVSTTGGPPGDTDFIYLALRPPANAGDGLTENWGYRLSFLYP